MKQAPLLIVFLGFPGSGKTYFATRLAEKLQAVTLNTDALRGSMFGTLDVIEYIRQTDRARLYNDVFGAMDYAATQILQAGHSVIYDAQQTKRRDRKNIEKIASSVDALPILVWMKTSPEVALRRGQEREARVDSHQYSKDKMKMLINRFDKVTDLPDKSENVIEISGELLFHEQYSLFEKGVEMIRRQQTKGLE
jgi:predicted kinase